MKYMNELKHIALIMDGNRRWARKRGLKPWMGHFHGITEFENIFKAAIKNGVKYTSFWGASIDNVTKRDKKEVDFLMNIFTKEFTKLSNSEYVQEQGIRIRVIGEWKKYFPKVTSDAIKKCIKVTEKNNKVFVNFLLAYSGTKEMIDCIKTIQKKNLKVNSKTIKENLLTSELPAVDLLIRTGGEPHNSDGFMMWDMINAQYIFLKKHWPDFNAKDFDECVKEYYNRGRRMGA